MFFRMLSKIQADLLLASFISLSGSFVHAKDPPPPSAYGDATMESASFLYSEGQASFKRGLFTEAERLLQRLIDRHVEFEFRMDALLLLAQSKIELHKPSAAIPLLQTYLEQPHALGARIDAELLLGQAYLDTNRFHEAYLVSFELLHGESLKKLETESFSLLKALLLKAESQLGLNQANRADRTLVSLKSTLGRTGFSPPTHWVARVDQIELELKLRSCAVFPTQRILTEEQARDQMQRRGRCLSEALPIFEHIWSQKDLGQTRFAAHRLTVAYNAYRFALQAPPLPPGKRSPAQLRNYQLELVDRLSMDYLAHKRVAQNFFNRLGKTSDSSTKRILDEIQQEL